MSITIFLASGDKSLYFHPMTTSSSKHLYWSYTMVLSIEFFSPLSEWSALFADNQVILQTTAQTKTLNTQTQNPIIQPQEIDTNLATPALETDNSIQSPIHQVTGTKRDHPQTPTTRDVSSMNDDSLVSPNLKDPMPSPIDLVIPNKKQPKGMKNKKFKADNCCVAKTTSLNFRKAYSYSPLGTS
ncbi:hypothetical protein JTB14_007260 [Gonioctena quinquepunctata]|nr:hypothetical protein JTB14_007260 [Gonioctena quinquepunctata]